MRFEHHPLLTAIIANRRSRARRREDGIIEIVEHRSPSSAPLPIAPLRWWRLLASAMLSVPVQMLDAFIEGCALYAVSMNPGAFGFSVQDAECDDPPEDSIPSRSTPPQTDAPRACSATTHELRSNFIK